MVKVFKVLLKGLHGFCEKSNLFTEYNLQRLLPHKHCSLVLSSLDNIPGGWRQFFMFFDVCTIMNVVVLSRYHAPSIHRKFLGAVTLYSTFRFIVKHLLKVDCTLCKFHAI